MNMSRRDFLKSAAALAALSSAAKLFAADKADVTEKAAEKKIPSVFFTKEISPDSVARMQRILGIPLPGRVAVKVHSGEKGNQNYLRPEFLRPAIEAVGGTVVECNAAYEGARNSTEKHRRLIAEHGWTKLFHVDLMDAEGPDAVLAIPDGKILKRNYVGKNLMNYDSMLVLSHFKGHPAAGYGGALKQLAIGCASIKGKALIHSGGLTGDQNECWLHMAEPEVFGDAMADAASSIVKLFRGRLAFVNMMCNLSVDCDCCAVAEDPCMKDVGVLSSTDPVALDAACMDLIRMSTDPGRDHFLERVESLKGTRVIDASDRLGFGSKKYRLIRLDA